MTKDKWLWMPHAGHLIVGSDCRFHLNTYVGKYIVSTVGEYLPPDGVREVLAKLRKKPLSGMGDARRADWMRKFGYEDIGLGRKYETMVFRASKDKKNKCCPWGMRTPSNIDFRGYNSAEDAMKGHKSMCLKWSKK